MKTTTPLYKLFRKSPFKAVQEHMRVVAKCMDEFKLLFDALFKKDQNGVKEIAEKIDKIESEADEIKNSFRLNMPKSIFLPVARNAARIARSFHSRRPNASSASIKPGEDDAPVASDLMTACQRAGDSSWAKCPGMALSISISGSGRLRIQSRFSAR